MMLDLPTHKMQVDDRKMCLELATAAAQRPCTVRLTGGHVGAKMIFPENVDLSDANVFFSGRAVLSVPRSF